MNKYYDQEYLKNTVSGLILELYDLDVWSVYNDDEYNEEVDELRKIVDRISKKAGVASPKKEKHE